MQDGARYRVDELRRYATALGSAAGLAPERASALATHLLWFDTAGLPRHGIATLPDWLERIDQKRVDPGAEGRVLHEHAATVVLDGQNGLAPLVLSRAAGLASEKARDVGVGLVRVLNLADGALATPVAAEVAIGPEISWIMGPGPSWTLALPSPEGLPLLFDRALAGSQPAQAPNVLPLPLTALLSAWSVLAPDGGWLVAAIAVAALEPLATFHERIGEVLARDGDSPGVLLPARWESIRAHAREHGLALGESPLAALDRCAQKLGVDRPLARAH